MKKENYKRSTLFIWINGLASWLFTPFKRVKDYRKATKEISVIQAPQSIAVDLSHHYTSQDVYWQKFSSSLQSEPVFTITIPDASLISKGILLNKESEVILESTLFQKEYLNILNSNHLIFLQSLLPTTFAPKIISLLNKLDNSYFHWTLESLTRILLVYKTENFKDHKIVIKADPLPFIKESLEFLFDIEASQLLEKPLLKRIKAEEALVISFPHIRNRETKMTNVYIPEVIRDLNRLALKKLEEKSGVLSGYPKNILISRNDAIARRIINETEVLSHLGNFEGVALEDYSYIEQVALFAQADYVVGIHGAGMTNILYARNAVLIEIFPKNRNIRDAFYFAQITGALGITHHLIIEESINKEEDMVFSPRTLRQIENLTKS